MEQLLGWRASVQGSRFDPAAARQSIEGGGRLGKRMALEAVAKLQAMLDPTQELVRGAEAKEVAAAQVPFVMQALQRHQGGVGTQPGVGTAVEPLQALGEELDVTDSAGRKLDVPLSSVASGAGAALEVARDLLASVEYRFHRAKVELAAINQWLHLAQKAPANLHVSGRAACLDEHL